MKTIILIMCLLGMGCEYVDFEKQKTNPLRKVQVGKTYDYNFNHNEKFNSIEEIGAWINQNIKSKLDVTDYWQLPEETYRLKTGDCEDKTILAMYFVKTQLNIDIELLLIDFNFADTSHTITKIKNKYYDFTTKDLEPYLNYRIIFNISYEETIWMTYYYHLNIGVYY